MSTSCILVVDDEPDIRALVKGILEDEGYCVYTAENAKTARITRRMQRLDLILLDIWMPDTDGITLLKEWNECEYLPCPVIIMSGHGTVETAVEATRLGAYDFIEKPLSMGKLLLTVERAIQADRLAKENIHLRRQQHKVVEPIGHSELVQKLRNQVLRIAMHDTPVLIFGEPGTGKKVYGRFLHNHSVRRTNPFIDVHFRSVARKNIALELFGSEQGEIINSGKLEQASGGTIFFDELTNIDLEVQAKLVNALEIGSFLRIGGTKQVKIDVRVIAATNRNLEHEIMIGHLREDFYYYLNVVPIKLAPLRTHVEDIPELLNYYINYFVDQEGLSYRHFTLAAQNRLRNYHWPGNIRELKNLVKRLLIINNDEEITSEEVEVAIRVTTNNKFNDNYKMPLNLTLKEAREYFERNFLIRQLRECEGNVARLADRVGMERTNLYRKLRTLGIDPKKT